MKKILIAVISLIVVGIGALVYIKITPQPVTIPDDLAQQMQIPLYLPGWLPGDYQIDRDSFAIEEGRILVFSATDSERNRLFFSQQSIGEGFDFERFYNTQMINAAPIEDTPFETRYGRSVYSKTWILSMKTESSWIMMSTQSPIDSVMAQKMAQEMKRY